MTSIEEFMGTRGLADEVPSQVTASCGNGDFKFSGGTIHVGSHIDAVGKRRITVMYPATGTRRVAALARAQGVRPPGIYRTALS